MNNMSSFHLAKYFTAVCGEKTPVIADSRHNEYKWLFVHESDYNIKHVGTSISLISVRQLLWTANKVKTSATALQ